MMHNIFSKEGREAIRWWFSDDPKITKEREEYCKKIDKERAILRKKGYILQNNGIWYTEEQILNGESGLNGTLVKLGYRRIGNTGKWSK